MTFVMKNYMSKPGPDSQSSTLPIQNIVAEQNIDMEYVRLGFFYNISAPVISPPTTRDWDEAARHILEEYAETWQKLAEV